MKNRNNLIKNITALVLILLSIVLGGCFTKKEEQVKPIKEETEKAQNINVLQEENGIKVIAQNNFLSATLEVGGIIEDSKIESNNDIYKIVYTKENKTYIVLAKKDVEFKANDELFKISNIKDNIAVRLMSCLKKSDMSITPSAIKRVGEITHTLLGDIDKDGEVGLPDYATFKKYFALFQQGTATNRYLKECDIFPSSLGTKAGWESVYSINWNPDNIIDAKDFVVFLQNYTFKENFDKPVFSIASGIYNNNCFLQEKFTQCCKVNYPLLQQYLPT